MNKKVLLVKSDVLGSGPDQLGTILMSVFTRLLGESAYKPAKIIFLNSGVKLCCEGSNVLEYLETLQEQGVEMLSCTTCLEYFDIKSKLKVGQATTMGKTIETLFEYEVVSI
jgi:selenium metabolism protein YedF